MHRLAITRRPWLFVVWLVLGWMGATAAVVASGGAIADALTAPGELLPVTAIVVLLAWKLQWPVQMRRAHRVLAERDRRLSAVMRERGGAPEPALAVASKAFGPKGESVWLWRAEPERVEVVGVVGELRSGHTMRNKSAWHWAALELDGQTWKVVEGAQGTDALQRLRTRGPAGPVAAPVATGVSADSDAAQRAIFGR